MRTYMCIYVHTYVYTYRYHQREQGLRLRTLLVGARTATRRSNLWHAGRRAPEVRGPYAFLSGIDVINYLPRLHRVVPPAPPVAVFIITKKKT